MRSPFDTEERMAFRETGDFPWRIHEELGAMGYLGFGIVENYGFIAVGGSSEEIMRDLAVRQRGL